MHGRESAECFDVAAIARLEALFVSDDRAELGGFIDDCLGSVAALIAQVERADAMDAEQRRRAVHTLATQSALIGAEELASLARQIERQPATDSSAAATTLPGELRPAYERFRCALQREREAWPTR
jgi:HPt (histidine-containing phosphotransfer) domain-containing protein